MSAACEVLVAGAGVAGATAAVAAARSGARTILVEKEPYLGGTGYAGMFQYICGLYLNAETPPAEPLNGGIVREIVAMLHRASPGRTVQQIGQVYVLPYGRDDLQAALTELCNNEKNVTVLRGHAVTAVATGNGGVREVTVEGPRGRQTMLPAVLIDCSGSGSVSAMAGAAFELAPEDVRQLAGYVILVQGLKQVDENISLKVPYHLARAAAKGLIAPAARFTTFSRGERSDEGYCKINVANDGRPGGEERVREQADAVVRHLRSVLPAFEEAYIAGTSLTVLEREGRRVSGEYTLTGEDVLSARKFPDGVVKNSWPIELWDRSKGSVYQYVPRGDYYEVPFRCLKARDLTNLLVAGRCISVTHEALGSTRVMGACMALGEQAGLAAAYRAKNGTYPENVKEL